MKNFEIIPPPRGFVWLLVITAISIVVAVVPIMLLA